MVFTPSVDQSSAIDIATWFLGTRVPGAALRRVWIRPRNGGPVGKSSSGLIAVGCLSRYSADRRECAAGLACRPN